MGGRAVRGGLVAAFALAVGHRAWHAVVGPPATPKYFVGGQVDALTGHDPAAKHLYLRRTLHLPRRPRRAWLQVLGRDRLRLYVNGSLVEEQQFDGYPV